MKALLVSAAFLLLASAERRRQSRSLSCVIVLEIFLKTNPAGEKIEYALATKARRHGADAVAARASSASSLPSRARCPDIQCGMPGTIATTRAETTCAFNKTIKINGIQK